MLMTCFLSENEKLILLCKKKLASEFEMKDLGLMHYFLGLEVWQRKKEIFLGQRKYTIDILKRFGMLDCKSMATLDGCKSEEVDGLNFRF